RLIQDSLSALLADRTSFVIAHRLTTIMHADQIVVLEAGRIVERGRHDELLRSSGQYRRMIELQIVAESAGAPPAPAAALPDDSSPSSRPLERASVPRFIAPSLPVHSKREHGIE